MDGIWSGESIIVMNCHLGFFLVCALVAWIYVCLDTLGWLGSKRGCTQETVSTSLREEDHTWCLKGDSGEAPFEQFFLGSSYIRQLSSSLLILGKVVDWVLGFNYKVPWRKWIVLIPFIQDSHPDIGWKQWWMIFLETWMGKLYWSWSYFVFCHVWYISHYTHYCNIFYTSLYL